MKFICTFLLLFLFVHVYGKNDTYSHLAAINKCWAEQTDYPALPDGYASDDKGWIRLHLSLVEQSLRNRSVTHLNASQKAKRLRALQYLHDYWQQGNFPVNDKYTERTPVFIDDHDNFCAVGYLVKATGHEHISRMISSKTNLAYVREMHYPELNAWAKEYGFTTEELAWIQPTYGPEPHAITAAIGKGTNGVVTALFVDGADNKLYVGGSFSKVDSTIDAQNIAYVTESNGVYTWHTLGGGLNGFVYAICEYQNKIFAGGSFTMAGNVPVSNVAYWDGTSWHDAGCIFGTIKDFIVHNDGLFAVGDFDVCAALSEVNVAKWNSTNNMWSQMPALDGHVNTVASYNGNLIFGGQFAWMNDTVNIIKWSEDTGYETYANDIKNEVMDIGLFKDTLYAVCKRTYASDSMIVQKLIENTWTGYSVLGEGSLDWVENDAYNTFCVHNNNAMIGGDFDNWEMWGPSFRNCLDLGWMNGGGNWFFVDSTINKMIVYKGELVFGGAFKTGENLGMPNVALNGIGKKFGDAPTGVKDRAAQQSNFKIYPNPTQANGILKIESSMDADNLELKSIDGRSIGAFKLAARQSEIRLPSLSPGTYLILLTDKKGMKVGQKLIINK